MKVLRWQEASLESSKGFYKGRTTYLKSLRHPYPEIPENLTKSMKIYVNLWKSIENNESPQMTRSQPGIEQRFLQGQWPGFATPRSVHQSPTSATPRKWISKLFGFYWISIFIIFWSASSIFHLVKMSVFQFKVWRLFAFSQSVLCINERIIIDK